jgi:hypothetical protein
MPSAEQFTQETDRRNKESDRLWTNLWITSAKRPFPCEFKVDALGKNCNSLHLSKLQACNLMNP